MNSKKSETIADIIREMRTASKAAYEGRRGWPECWKDQIAPDTAEDWADRIEAAVRFGVIAYGIEVPSPITRMTSTRSSAVMSAHGVS